MALAIAALAPVLVMAALALQGCFGDYLPAVFIAINDQCALKVKDVSDAQGLKDISASHACGSLDQAKLKELGVTDCSDVVHSIVQAMLTAECEGQTITNDDVRADCSPFGGKKCKAAVDKTVTAFAPYTETDAPPEQAQAGFEAVLGLANVCLQAMDEVTSTEASAGDVAKACNDKTDPTAMATMGLDMAKCKAYVATELSTLGAIACVLSGFDRDDAPTSPDAVTLKWLQSVAADFKARISSVSGATKAFEGELGKMAPGTRLRLFAVLRNGRWPGQLRRWHCATTVAVSAAFAIASAALLGAAWRRSSAYRPHPQAAEDTAPMLEKVMEPTA